jgi:hypothetical protein
MPATAKSADGRLSSTSHLFFISSMASPIRMFWFSRISPRNKQHRERFDAETFMSRCKFNLNVGVWMTFQRCRKLLPERRFVNRFWHLFAEFHSKIEGAGGGRTRGRDGAIDARSTRFLLLPAGDLL